MRHVETYAVVGDVIHRRRVALQGANANHRLFRLAAELPGVLQQVLHGDPHQRLVGADAHARLDDPLHRSAGGLPVYGVGDLARDCAEVDLGHVDLGAGHLGQPEDVVDEITHALARGADAIQRVLALFVQLVAVVLE